MAAVDEVDIGFSLNAGEATSKQIDLGSLLTTEESDVQVVPDDTTTQSGEVPNLLKYLDNSESSKEGLDLTPNLNGYVKECTDVIKSQPVTADTISENPLLDNLTEVGNTSAELPVSITNDPTTVETSNGQDMVINAETPLTRTTSDEYNPLASILSDVLTSITHKDDLLEINMSDSLSANHECLMLDDGKALAAGQLTDFGKLDDKSHQQTVGAFGDTGAAKTESCERASDDVWNLNPAGDRHEEKEVFIETTQETERTEHDAKEDKKHSESDLDHDIIDEDEMPEVSALKNNQQTDNDNDDFTFELPQKVPDTQFEISGLKDKIAAFEKDFKSLQRFNTEKPVTEPYEQVQQEIQGMLNDASKCQEQLNDIQNILRTLPPKHDEYESINSWCESSECELKQLQQQTQIRLSEVLEAINRKQANLITKTTPETDNLLGVNRELKAAEAEWATVQCVTPEIGDESAEGRRLPTKVSTIPSVGYADVLDRAKSTFNLSQYEPVIKTSIPRRGFIGFLHRLFGTKLHKNLHDEQKLVFCLAACPYQDDIPCHWHVLHSIYRSLTGAKVDTPRYGGHWETIGFQGNDPATDLRGAGFLGLLQLLYLLSNPSLLPLAKEMYKLSLHETQNFPFCVMGINITSIVLRVLREDHLNKECNKRKQVLEVVNEFYVALWFHLYTIWKTQHKTIRDTGYVMSDIETSAKKRPQALIASLNTHLAQHKSRTSPAKDKEEISFQAVCDFDDD